MAAPQPVLQSSPVPPHPTHPTAQAPYQPAPGQQQFYPPPPSSHQSYQPTPAQPPHQGQGQGQYPHNVQAPLPTSPSPLVKSIDEASNEGRVGYFLFGMVMSFFLGIFSFLFLCCAENIGLTPRRKRPFIVGIIVGTLLQWIIGGIIIAVAVRNGSLSNVVYYY